MFYRGIVLAYLGLGFETVADGLWSSESLTTNI